MEVVLDGKTGLVAPDSGTTLQIVFEGLRKSASLRRRVVVSFTLDGEVLTTERQAGLSSQSPGNYGLLEVKTVDPFSFSLDTLTGLLAHVKNMERTHDEAAAFVESGEYSKALERFDSCIQGWEILIRAVRDVGGLSSADFQSLQAAGESVAERMLQIQDTLLRFSAAFEFKDIQKVIEIAQEELRPRLSHWRAVVESLSQHVAKNSGATA